MIIVCTVIVFFMAGSMFFISRDKKIALILLSAMIFSLLEMDIIPFYRNPIGFLTITFLMSEIKNITKLSDSIKKNKSLKTIVFLLFVMVSLDIIFSPHLHSIYEVFRYINTYILQKYLLLFCAFFAIKQEYHFYTIIKYSMIGIGILTIFGIINAVYGQSFFVTEMLSNHINPSGGNQTINGDYYINQDRFRVQSMFQNPFCYGYICTICLMLFIYAKEKINKWLFITMILCCIFGILMCGCRTILICTLGGLGIYMLSVYQVKRIVNIFFVCLIFLCVTYSFVPIVANKIDSVATVFADTEGKGYEGSNLTMRSIQLAATMNYVKNNPLFGNGVNYFNIDLGWRDETDAYRDRSLYGLEGVYLVYLLEHGWVGYILYLCVWIILLVAVVKGKTINKKIASLAISIWIVYIIFANMTGELNSVMPTVLILGGSISMLTLKTKTV